LSRKGYVILTGKTEGIPFYPLLWNGDVDLSVHEPNKIPMKKIAILILSLGFATGIWAQTGSVQETAMNFMRSGDFDNAILVLNKGLQQDANNLELQKNLALAYYLKRDFAQAQEQVNKLMERDDADVASYQIAGDVYKAMEMVKEADRMYKKALKKFPNSGPLYSEYGELLFEKHDPEAIKLWEKGIQADPSYAGNYYNAALYYQDKNFIWTLLYGEIFVNMENLTPRATAMKKLLLDTYKGKLFLRAARRIKREPILFMRSGKPLTTRMRLQPMALPRKH
jgi:Tfp pilus assembly protein PilF